VSTETLLSEVDDQLLILSLRRRSMMLHEGFPTIVCLCGSTRFMHQFQEAEYEETLAGRIVLTIGCDTKSDDMLRLGEGIKAKLDELHLRKVELADEVLVLNVGGYIGESTQRELDHAIRLGKRVRFLVPM